MSAESVDGKHAEYSQIEPSEKISAFSQLLKDVANTGDDGQQFVDNSINHWSEMVLVNISEEAAEKVNQMRAERDRRKEAVANMNF